MRSLPMRDSSSISTARAAGWRVPCFEAASPRAEPPTVMGSLSESWEALELTVPTVSTDVTRNERADSGSAPGELAPSCAVVTLLNPDGRPTTAILCDRV